MENSRDVSLVQIGPVVVATFETASLKNGVWQEAFQQMQGLLKDSRPTHLLLEWFRVDDLAADTLTDLAKLVNAADAVGGSLRLCGLPEKLRGQFEAARLDGLVLGEDVPDALPRYVCLLHGPAETGVDGSVSRILQNSI
jgi:anti-anti-sigma regulatory factor